MSYAPVFLPGQAVTYTASAAITGGQVVAVGTTGYNVAPTSAASDAVVGVASNDQDVVGATVTVYSGGVHRLTASGSISIGDRVIAAAAGAVATFGADADFTHRIGKALTAATNGQTVDVLLTL
jgi:hypothetical protein